jgi:hypothetical protein
MERLAHKSTSHNAAAAWDRKQARELSVDERQAIARELKRRAFGTGCLDVREAARQAPAS